VTGADRSRRDDLAGGWARLLTDAGASAPAEAVAAEGERLRRRWAEPHRRYHDQRHLREVLAALDTLTTPEAPPVTARLAAWFHDAVHDGRAGADEEASAVLAEQVLTGLGVPSGPVAEVARLVRLTAAHDPATGDPTGALLVDADLAILAAPTERYRDYVAAIRAEYAHVPDAVFAAGRAAVLDRLVGNPRLFRTDRGYAVWETAARTNVGAELSRLRG